jgi:hypothetical protein
MYEIQKGFIPIGKDKSLLGEFDCYVATDHFAFHERDGMRDWKGSNLEPIKADEALPHVDLPQRLKDLMKHCWQVAKPSAGMVQGGGPVQLAGARMKALGNMAYDQRAQAMARGAYVKQVSPTEFPAKPGMEDHGQYLQGLATDWGLMNQLERINAYSFRGDKRNPIAIKGANGFQPPVTRQDRPYIEGAVYEQFSSYLLRRFNMNLSKQDFLRAYDTDDATRSEWEKHVFLNFTVWRALADREAMHVGRMLAEQALKGYTSTSKAVPVAKGFAGTGGWVYLTLVKGGFVVPDRDKHPWTILYGEQEIALPGGLAWADIYGFREVSPDAVKFRGPIYFRRGFATAKRAAFEKAHDLFSGKVQE